MDFEVIDDGDSSDSFSSARCLFGDNDIDVKPNTALPGQLPISAGTLKELWGVWILVDLGLRCGLVSLGCCLLITGGKSAMAATAAGTRGVMNGMVWR